MNKLTQEWVGVPPTPSTSPPPVGPVGEGSGWESFGIPLFISFTVKGSLGDIDRLAASLDAFFYLLWCIFLGFYYNL